MIMSPSSKVEISPLIGLIAEEVAHEEDTKNEYKRGRASWNYETNR